MNFLGGRLFFGLRATFGKRAEVNDRQAVDSYLRGLESFRSLCDCHSLSDDVDHCSLPEWGDPKRGGSARQTAFLARHRWRSNLPVRIGAVSVAIKAG